MECLWLRIAQFQQLLVGLLELGFALFRCLVLQTLCVCVCDCVCVYVRVMSYICLYCLYVFELCVLCGQFMCYEYVQSKSSLSSRLPTQYYSIEYPCLKSQ